MYNLQENLQISIWLCHLFQSTPTSVSSALTRSNYLSFPQGNCPMFVLLSCKIRRILLAQLTSPSRLSSTGHSRGETCFQWGFSLENEAVS